MLYNRHISMANVVILHPGFKSFHKTSNRRNMEMENPLFIVPKLSLSSFPSFY